jgi:hypothetical protein
LNRVALAKVHLLLAAFMFPAALMFLITGGLYTWGIKGSYEIQVIQVVLDKPLAEDQAALTHHIENELQALSIEVPSGGAKIKRAGTSFQFEWTGSGRDVVLEPTANPLVAKLTIKETTWYRNFVQLHKAKGGQLFKVYAAALAIALFVILLSGFLMAWRVSRLRQQAIWCATAGLLLFFLVVMLS